MSSLSRLEKLGTIFTRVRDLMRAGVMKETDKPLWYDVMAAFPPRDPPVYKRYYQKDFLPEVLYKEDAVRSQFYKVYGGQKAIDLTKDENVKLSPCYRFITKYQELEKEGTRVPDELFEATAIALAEEGLLLKKQTERRKPTSKEDAVKPSRGPGPSTSGLAFLLKQALKEQSNQKDEALKTTPESTSTTEDER